MIALLPALFIFAQPALPSLVTPAAQRTVRYRIKRKRHRIAPPSSTRADVIEVEAPPIKQVRVIPIVRAGATTWLLWNERIDPATDARARAAARGFLTPSSVQGVTK
jgi:hypothetical protein